MGGTSLAKDLALIIEAGATMVAVMGASFRATGAEEAARLIRDSGLAVSSFHGGLRILDITDEAEADAVIGAAIRDAATAGSPHVAVSAGPLGGRTYAQADEVYVARLSRAAPLARKLGVALGIEPVHPLLCAHGYIHTLRHGAEVVSRIEGASIVLDTAHVFWDRDCYADIARHVGLIGMVQLGQLSGPGLVQRRWVRAPFSEGAIPMADILHAVHEAGYRGVYEHENIMEADVPPDVRVATVKADSAWFASLW
jgi:sugar phosphate isomerase/epimerase